MADTTHDRGTLTPPPSTNQRYEAALELATRSARAQYGGWSEVDRENLVTEVMIKYWQTFGNGPGPDNNRAWLSRVIGDTAIDAKRGDAVRPSVPAGNMAVDLDPTHAWVNGWLRAVEKIGPSNSIASSPLMDETLDLLSASDRELITRKYLYCDPTRQIAAILGSTETATSQAIGRAKRRLSIALTAEPALLKELREAMPQAY